MYITIARHLVGMIRRQAIVDYHTFVIYKCLEKQKQYFDNGNGGEVKLALRPNVHTALCDEFIRFLALCLKNYIPVIRAFEGSMITIIYSSFSGSKGQ